MILNPSTTGLLIIGASSFRDNSEEAGRQSLLCASRRVQEYFLDPHLGLGISKDNTLNLFNSEIAASQQSTRAFSYFIEREEIMDIFVYIIGHGTPAPETNSFLLRVWDSDDLEIYSVNGSSYLHFISLYDKLFSTGKRLFFIVNACHSGIIHSEVEKYESEKTQEFGMNSDRRVVIMTSNSSEKIGPVDGKDKHELPHFEDGIFAVLTRGDEQLYDEGLSLQALSAEVNVVLRKKEKPGKRAFKVNKCQVSDYHHSNELGPLSDVPVFPNCNRDNLLVRDRRKSFEIEKGKQLLEKAKEKIQELTDINDELTKSLNEAEVDPKIKRHTSTIEDRPLQPESQDAHTEFQEDRKRNHRRWLWIIMLILAAIVYLSVSDVGITEFIRSKITDLL